MPHAYTEDQHVEQSAIGLFAEHKAGLVKIIGQNHQFLGVNAAFRRMLRMRGMNLDLHSPSPAQ